MAARCPSTVSSNTVILYPQIPHTVASHLFDERRALSVAKAAEIATAEHADMFYTPTGGTRAARSDLESLRNLLLQVATDSGYPASCNGSLFDANAAAVLHKKMLAAPSEASKPGVWEFITCVLACDLVRWRFGGNGDPSPSERFFAGRRNTFERLWWRAFVLEDSSQPEQYWLLNELGEDEIVQIMERPFLSGSRVLSRAVGAELLVASERFPGMSRRVLIREAQKKLRRLGAFVAFEPLEISVVRNLVRSIFEDVGKAGAN